MEKAINEEVKAKGFVHEDISKVNWCLHLRYNCHNHVYRHYFQSHNIYISRSSLSFVVAQNANIVLNQMKAAGIMKGALKDIFIFGNKDFSKPKILWGLIVRFSSFGGKAFCPVMLMVKAWQRCVDHRDDNDADANDVPDNDHYDNVNDDCWSWWCW